MHHEGWSAVGLHLQMKYEVVSYLLTYLLTYFMLAMVGLG